MVSPSPPSWSVSFGLAEPDADTAIIDRPYVAPRFRRGVRIDDDSRGVSLDDDAAAGGAPVDPRRVAREKAAEKRASRAANVSIAALTRRGMSRWELGNTLASRGLDVHEVDAELDRLQAVGLIDDAALADTLVRTQHDRKGLGRSALVSELRRRHIDRDHIDAALEQLDGYDELIRATELAERRAPQLRSLDHETAKRRLTAFLMRKGYSSGIVRAAVDGALTAGVRTVRFD